MAIEISCMHPSATEIPLEGHDLQNDEPIAISCSMSDDGVKVCDICGDTGYDEMLARCSKCNEGAEHVYCMQTILDSVPLNWICERCKAQKGIDCPKQVNFRCDSQEDTFESTSLGCFDRQNSIESSKCPSSCISEQGTEMFERVEMVKHTLSLSSCKKRLADASSNPPISKKLAVEGVSLPLQPTNLLAKPTLSRENSYKSYDSKKVKFLSPSAVASLSTGVQSPRTNKAASKNACLVYASSPIAGSGKSIHVSSAPKLPSPSSLRKEASGYALLSTNNSALSLHKKSLLKKANTLLHKSASPKFDEGVPSFLLPSKPSSLLRSSKEATLTKLSVENTAAVSKTSNVVIPSNVLNSPTVSKVKPGPSASKLRIHRSGLFENGKENSINLGSAFKGTGVVDVNSIVSEFGANFQMACIEPSQGGLPKGFHREPDGLQKHGSLQGLEPSIGSSKWHNCKKTGNSSLVCTKVRPSKIPEVTVIWGLEGQKVSSNTISPDQYGSSLGKQLQSQAPLACKPLEKQGQGEQLEAKHKNLQINKSCFESKVAKLCSNPDGIPTTAHQFVGQEIHKPTSCMEAAIHSGASVIPTYPVPQDSSFKKSSGLSGNDQRQAQLDQKFLKWKCDLGIQSLQNPIVRQVRGVESFLLSQPSQSLTGNVHSKTLISSVERETNGGQLPYPENYLVIQNTPGLRAMPQLCMTRRHSAQHPNYDLEMPALDKAAFVWQGSIQVTSNGNIAGSYYGLQACPSPQADPKVYQFMKSFPPQLEAEELQQTAQNNTWPRSFNEKSLDSNSIGVFLLASESHKESYQQLLGRMIAGDLALRICLESSQLLFFPSNVLPKIVECWSDMCLCGVFLANKAAHHSMRSTLTNIRQPGSGNNACDILHLETDMIGGREMASPKGPERVGFPGSKADNCSEAAEWKLCNKQSAELLSVSSAEKYHNDSCLAMVSSPGGRNDLSTRFISCSNPSSGWHFNKEKGQIKETNRDYMCNEQTGVFKGENKCSLGRMVEKLDKEHVERVDGYGHTHLTGRKKKVLVEDKGSSEENNSSTLCSTDRHEQIWKGTNRKVEQNARHKHDCALDLDTDSFSNLRLHSYGKRKHTCIPSECHCSAHYHQSQSSSSSNSAATEVGQIPLKLEMLSERLNGSSTNCTDVLEKGAALTGLERTDKHEKMFEVKLSNNSIRSKLTGERVPFVQVQESEAKFGQERINALCVLSDVKDCNADDCATILYDQECKSIVGKASTNSSLWEISTQLPMQSVNCLTLFPDGKGSEELNTMVPIINGDKKSKMDWQREECKFFLKPYPFIENLERFECRASNADLEAGSSRNPHSVPEDGTFDVGTCLTLALPHHRKSETPWVRHEDDETLSCNENIDFSLSLSLGVKRLAK